MCSKWKDDRTKCVLTAPSSWSRQPSLSYSHRCTIQPDLSFGCRSCGFRNCYGARSSHVELFRISPKGMMNSYFVWERSVCCNMTPTLEFSNVLVGEGGKITLQSRLNRVRILLLIWEKIFYVASFPSFFGIDCLKKTMYGEVKMLSVPPYSCHPWPWVK
jgi:hypothetical protein